MFVRARKRFKDGKEHRHWSVVENCRNPDGRVVQRQVLHLGEINDSQRSAWCRSIEVLCGESSPKSVALFPADREAPELDCEVVRIEPRGLRLRREGRHLLRCNLTGEDPATLWRYYMQLVEVEQAFKELKHDLAIRPVFHQREDRIEAHILVAFIAH